MRRILAAVVVVSVLWIGARHFLNAPANPKAGDAVRVEIPQGLGARGVAKKLTEAGLLRSPIGFVILVALHDAKDRIKAGTYELRPRESGRAILARLIRGDALPTDLTVTIPEGFTLEQIADRLAAQGITDKDAFTTASAAGRFRSEFSFLERAPADATLEGYLFPDTYRFARGSAAEEVVRRMLRRFSEQWERALAEATLPAGRSVHDVVTMASIVEREVRSAEDRKLVAGVLWKRLDAGIGLEADATVRYATKAWENPLTVEDLRLDSPYNTRRYRGLPPGPIGNPGLDTLEAALNPAGSEFLYYLSAPDGRTIFSKALDEHNRAKAHYLSGSGP